MIQALLKNILGPVALVLAGIIGGAFGTMKLQKPVTPEYKCPDCHCPEPTVSIQPFEVDKIKGLRSFVYTPQFSGSIQVAGVDSTALRKMIDESMDKAMKKYTRLPETKRGRKAAQLDEIYEKLDKDRIRKIARQAAQRTDDELANRYKEMENRFRASFDEADQAFDLLDKQ